ncbi:MAG: periplasmic heavy metal sensor, partial [Blastocatellia bacterium]
MAPIDKDKWQVRVSVVAIFVLGAIAGALGMNIYRGIRPNAPPPGGHPRGFERMFDNLNLTPDQKSKVDQILADSRKKLMEVRRESAPQFSQVRQETEDRLKAVLTPQQWQQFQDQIQQNRQRRPHHRMDWG